MRLTRRLARAEERAAWAFPVRRAVTAEAVAAVEALGVASHVEPEEVGRLSPEIWMTRFTDAELKKLSEGHRP